MYLLKVLKMIDSRTCIEVQQHKDKTHDHSDMFCQIEVESGYFCMKIHNKDDSFLLAKSNKSDCLLNT